MLRFIITAFFLVAGSLDAVYTTVYSTNTNGAIAFTGNTLGLNKASNQNKPGTSGSIGAFITLNNTQVNNYPLGTTLNWTQNSSSAVLDLPPGSTVLFAELVWSGSYGFDPAITNNDNLSSGATTNTPITFATPSGTHIIKPTLAKSRVNSGSNGFYVRGADVTSYVQASGAGVYTVGGVPATVIAGENNLNCAGWTLCVAYQNFSMLSGNLSIIVGCEASGASPALITGFHAPDTGSISGRLFASALEGDPQLTGDQFLIGKTLPLTSPANQISGTNNPANNFFASQINTLLNFTTDLSNGKLVAVGSSVLDTRGTFGLLNSQATGQAISGARQGYDITSIDIGSKIQNSQTNLYAQGTTTNDVYTITALGLQIQFKAPSIQSTKSANDLVINNVGDTVTYTLTFKNVGELQADNVVLTDDVPTGMSFVAGTLKVNGVPHSGDPNTGVSLGNLAVNQTVTVVFDVVVDQIETAYVNTGVVDYSFTPDGTTTPVHLSSQTNDIIVLPPLVPNPIAVDDVGFTDANTVLNGDSLLDNDSGEDIEVSSWTNPSHGSIVIQPDGVYTYTPDLNYSGLDSFTYTIVDILGRTATATVKITVYPVALGDSYSVASNVVLTIPAVNGVLANDAGSGLHVTSYDVVSTALGSVNVNANGSFNYLSFPNFSGVDTFTYVATDSNGQTTMALVTILVLPRAQDNFGVTPANTVLNGSTVFTNDIGSGLTITSYQNPSAQGGGVIMNIADGTYVYTPPTNFSGYDTFTYTEKDAYGSISTATVTITVLPIALNNEGETNANTPLNAPSVLFNDLGTALFVSSYDQTTIQGGQVVMNQDGTYLYTPPLNFSGIDTFTYTAEDEIGNHTTATVTITVLPLSVYDIAETLANTPFTGPSVLNNDIGTALTVTEFQNPSLQGGYVSMNANRTYYYSPPLNFSGIDTFTYTAVDAFGNSIKETVTINVLPIANNQYVETSLNTPITENVLTNDIGSNLMVVAPFPVQSHAGGSVVINSHGEYTYTPPPGFIGQDSFTYTAQDGSGNKVTATVFITVTPLPLPKIFKGNLVTCEFLNRTKYSVNAEWSAASSPVVAYRLYLLGKRIAEVPVKAPRAYTICLASKHDAKKIEITTVDALGNESAFKKIRITNE